MCHLAWTELYTHISVNYLRGIFIVPLVVISHITGLCFAGFVLFWRGNSSLFSEDKSHVSNVINSLSLLAV